VKQLKEYHGSRVGYDLQMLQNLVHAGLADPELLRMQFRSAGERVAARFQPTADDPMVAAAPYASAIVNPLSPPTITGTTFAIDLALKEPTRIVTPMILDLTAQRFFVDRVYTSAGGVQGGAVVYDEMAMDLYADRDVQRVTPGNEFPIVTFSRRAPRTAEVEKWGGKFYFTDEARDRNQVVLFVNAVRQLGNTMVRKINQRGVEILEAAITANSRTVSGNDWSSVITAPTGSQTNFTGLPQRDFAKADLIADQEEWGIDYNLWIMNPLQMFDLEGIYGDKLASPTASRTPWRRARSASSASRAPSRRRAGGIRTASSRRGCSRPCARSCSSTTRTPSSSSPD
jgi:hypothetical protein